LTLLAGSSLSPHVTTISQKMLEPSTSVISGTIPKSAVSEMKSSGPTVLALNPSLHTITPSPVASSSISPISPYSD
jgi:hypothetical protein